MKISGYGILYNVFRLPARLPLTVLYILADIIFFLLYYLLRYRRKVAADNIDTCFADADDSRKKQICRQFYRNFADYIVETIKLLHISDDEMRRRMIFENVDVIDNLTAAGKSVVVYFSHCGNWEWAPSVTLHASKNDNIDYCQVYRPLRNHAFDALMLKIRSRFGSKSFAKQTVLRDLIRLRSERHLSVTGFMSDQKPSHGDPTVALTFLNRPTAFISGTETLARRMEMAAVYWDMYKISRGHYKIVCRLITDNAANTEQGHITRTYAQMLQETIVRNPAIWLWTHKRWKNPVTVNPQ